MPAITINRVPLRVWKEIKTLAGSRSRYAQRALAAQLIADGRQDLANLLHPKPNAPMKNTTSALRPGTKSVPGNV